MKFRETIDYPITAIEVFRHLGAEQFWLRKYEMLGCSHIIIDHAEFTDRRISITLTRRAPVTMHIPAWSPVKPPDHITLTQTDSWDLRTQRGTFDVRFHLMPVHINGTMTMTETNGRAREALDCDARVNIPLVGHKLEDLLVSDLRKDFLKDAAATLTVMGC